MSGLHLKLRSAPLSDCDAAALGTDLAQQSVAQAGGQTLRCLGSNGSFAARDCFEIAPRTDGRVVIEGDLQHFHCLGMGWNGGQLIVEGDVGEGFASQLLAGSVWLRGNAAAGAAEQMRGGKLRIDGNVGDQLGRPLPGRRSGISGGRVIVAGRSGHRACYRMRRGTVLLLGDCGDGLGCDMVAGTIVVAGSVGPHAAAGMRRGTLVLPESARLSHVRFSKAIPQRLGIARILATDLMPDAKQIGEALQGTISRMLGDLSVGGMGEVWHYQP